MPLASFRRKRSGWAPEPISDVAVTNLPRDRMLIVHPLFRFTFAYRCICRCLIGICRWDYAGTVNTWSGLQHTKVRRMFLGAVQIYGIYTQQHPSLWPYSHLFSSFVVYKSSASSIVLHLLVILTADSLLKNSRYFRLQRSRKIHYRRQAAVCNKSIFKHSIDTTHNVAATGWQITGKVRSALCRSAWLQPLLHFSVCSSASVGLRDKRLNPLNKRQNMRTERYAMNTFVISLNVLSIPFKKLHYKILPYDDMLPGQWSCFKLLHDRSLPHDLRIIAQ